MRISDISIGRPVTISPFSSTDDAITLMWRHDIRHLLVVDSDGLAGLVTDADMLESVGMLTLAERHQLGEPLCTEEILVADVMDAEAPCVHPEELVTDAAHRMIYEKRTALPVVSGNRLMGVLTGSDLLGLFSGTSWLECGSPHDEPVAHYGSHVLKTVSPCDRLSEACRKMSGGHIRDLLVVEGDRLVGVVSDWDIRMAIGHSRVGEWLQTPVAKVMVTGVQTLRPRDTLVKAVDIMRQDKLTAVPITRPDGTLISVLSVLDVLQAFAGQATIHA
jgi:CBS domain-containing protein